MGNRVFYQFPNAETADDSGLVVVTRSMNPDMVLSGYEQGIFAWSENPVRWYSPDPRAIFLNESIRIPRKLGKIIRRHDFQVTFDQDFAGVLEACSKAHEQRGGTWITQSFISTYNELHRQGYAHSVEVWQDSSLVGGLYGVQINHFFAGESMFFSVSNASKIAFAALVKQLELLDILLFDCQVINDHTHQLGAVLMARGDYLKLLELSIKVNRMPTKWQPTPPVFYN